MLDATATAVGVSTAASVENGYNMPAPGLPACADFDDYNHCYFIAMQTRTGSTTDCSTEIDAYGVVTTATRAEVFVIGVR